MHESTINIGKAGNVLYNKKVYRRKKPIQQDRRSTDDKIDRIFRGVYIRIRGRNYPKKDNNQIEIVFGRINDYYRYFMVYKGLKRAGSTWHKEGMVGIGIIGLI